jgi:hypothetical protein
MHETAHALAGHAGAMTIRSVTINVTGQSGADVDRENDPANANDKIRSNATPEEISALLPSMRRDLAVTVAGIVTENLCGVCRNGDPEDKIDEERAERLASTITLGQWNITPDRPPFDRREVGTSGKIMACCSITSIAANG